MSADWVLRGATVYARGRRAQAIAVRGDRIVYVGDDAGAGAHAGASTRTVDGGGLHVYAGFTDAHAHLRALGRQREEVGLEGAASLREALDRVREYARRLPADAWVTGRGWTPDEWQDRGTPTASALDEAAGGRRAALQRRDGHSVWVSTNVLRESGIDERTSDPPAGRIVRDARGHPTGVLVDTAMTLVDLPKEDAVETRRRLLAAQEHLLRHGVTGVHDMGVDGVTLDALHGLDDEGTLRLRVYAALDDHEPRWGDDFGRAARPKPPSALLAARAVKLFADGALSSRGAHMLEPYADDPENRGLVLLDPPTLRKKIRRIADAGLQPCIHAIGDAANRSVLDAYEEVLGRAHPLRPRIEHAQVVCEEDRPRFAALGIVVSMQPIHCVSDVPWAVNRLGPGRHARAYSWRSLLDTGITLAFGSDVPVETCDLRLGLYAAVTRRDPADPASEAWEPEQRLSLDESITAYTEGAAFARHAEQELGAVEAGFLADLTVFDRELEVASLLEARVAATIVAGEAGFAAEPGRWPPAR